MCITTSAYFQEYTMNFLEIAGKLDVVYPQNTGFHRFTYADNEAVLTNHHEVSITSGYYPEIWNPGEQSRGPQPMQLDPGANTASTFAPGQKSSTRKCSRI